MVSMTRTSSRVKRPKDRPLVLRGKITRARTGVHYERSISLTRPRADAFCFAMAARDDIRAAHVFRDHQATKSAAGDERFYVRFLRRAVPLSYDLPRRKSQDIRAQRAADQRGEMEFLPCLDKDGWYWCVHRFPQLEGEEAGRVTVYEVHPQEGCTCPDSFYRCVHGGLLCKHFINVRVHVGYLPCAQTKGHTEMTVEERAASVERGRQALASGRDF